MKMPRWTGNPFVDAGLAAIAAVTEKDLSALEPDDLAHAARELRRVLLSDQALGVGVKKAFVKGALSQLFPNSELVNPSNWRGKTPEERVENVRRKFQEGLHQDLERARQSLTQQGDSICLICGRKVPKEATVLVRKDRFPLLAGIVNFYPAFTHGVSMCGLCAFAIRFLPMAVMRTGVSNRLWFLHVQELPIAAAISRRYGWEHFNRTIAANEALDFYSGWETAGDAGTVLYLLYELLSGMSDQLRQIYLNPTPTTAYLFSNDNRNPYIQPLPIPNDLLYFLAKLHLESLDAFNRFWRELLKVKGNLEGQGRRDRIRFVQTVANRLLRGEGIVGTCLRHGDDKKDQPPKLSGGWLGHRLYLKEVRKMPEGKLAILERLGTGIAQSEDARKRIMELRQADRRDLYGLFLRYVREGWLKYEEFYTLLPPNEDASASELRDVLLAIIYEWLDCQEQGREFPSPIAEPSTLSTDEMLRKIEQIGERLHRELPNVSRWIGQLQTARTSEHVRRVYLLAVQRGALSFSDFIFLAPLGDRQGLWLLRDYLLAFLFDRAREALPEEEEIAAGEAVSEEKEVM